MPGPDGLTGVLYPILKEEITLISHKIFPEYRGGRNAFNSFCEVSIQFSSVTQSCLTLCDPTNCSTPGLPIHHQLSESTQTHNHLILCRPLLLLPSTFPSIRVFSKESAFCIRWPKYGSFSFNISPSNTQDWCPLGWTGWISLQPKELPRVFSNTTIKHTHTHTKVQNNILHDHRCEYSKQKLNKPNSTLFKNGLPSNQCRKSIWQTATFISDKNSQQTRNTRNILNLFKVIYQKLPTNISLMMKDGRHFP